MGETTTLIVLGIAAIITVAANLMSRRPYEPGRLPLIPYAAVQFIGVVVILLMLAHLITIWTGTPFVGRSRG